VLRNLVSHPNGKTQNEDSSEQDAEKVDLRGVSSRKLEKTA